MNDLVGDVAQRLSLQDIISLCAVQVEQGAFQGEGEDLHLVHLVCPEDVLMSLMRLIGKAQIADTSHRHSDPKKVPIT